MKTRMIGLVAAALALVATGAAAQQKLVVTSAGGIWLESAKQNFASCFKERTGQDVSIDMSGSSELLNKIRANPTNPPVHVVVLTEIDALRAGREGLLDKLSVEKVPNLADVPEIFRKQWGDYATIQNFGAMIVMVNSETVKDPPKDWKSLIDRTIAGEWNKRISYPAMTMPWGPMFTWFLTTQYGSDEAVWEKYKQIAPKAAKFWSSPVDALNMFGAKELDVVVYWDGRSYAFAEENKWAKAYVPEPGAFQSAALLAKVKNSPEIGWQYVDCVLSPKAQLGHSQMVKYPIVNAKVQYPDDLKKVLTPLDRVRQPEFDKFMDKIPAWVERWNKEIR